MKKSDLVVEHPKELWHVMYPNPSLINPLVVHKIYNATHLPRFVFYQTRTAFAYAENDFDAIQNIVLNISGIQEKRPTRFSSGQELLSSFDETDNHPTLYNTRWVYGESPNKDLMVLAFLRNIHPERRKSIASLDIFLEGDAVLAGNVFHDIATKIRSADYILFPDSKLPAQSTLFGPYLFTDSKGFSKTVWTPEGIEVFNIYNLQTNPLLL